MKRLVQASIIALLCLCVVGSTPAQARGGQFLLGFGLGTLCCGYAPYYSSYYYGYPTYYVPPTYYAPPPAVVYTQPASPPVTYYVAPPQTPLPATQAAPEFVDSQGRTCRKFQSSIDGTPVSGTACLQPDGTWHTVAE